MNLAEKRAGRSSYIGYLGKGRQKLDMNYVARHTGKKTQSNMQNGILDDQARSCSAEPLISNMAVSGAKGDEKEDVLLVGDTMWSTRPFRLILCAEEDVEGNHGASIGSSMKNMLFYAATRGIRPERPAEYLPAQGSMR